ncbi:porin [Prosthecodimorpha staleyi]|uniref:Porin n=1 Tax=Prosthecodimorpha staleyi TaxID=2840188 RepID=A0A947D909_9HYPH|nr:porin [Prosthecodimorpha staleyi]MBT9291731.1 porin [Prosthecodimorpha staleyi]
MMKSMMAGFGIVMATSFAAQAADLGRPAPAAVDYVKVCDAYGEGFFYIPGSQTCLKIGGYVRAEYRAWKTDDLFGSVYGLSNGVKGPANNTFTTRVRAQLTLDSRTNTEFGLLRSFTEAWYTVDSGSSSPSVDLWKAYIQLGGLTAGRAQSFFDFYTGDHYASVFETAHSDSQVNLLAYTFSFGNGVTASVSLEDSTTGNAARRMNGFGIYGGNKYPDLVGNVNITQAWGSAQLMGALHHDQPSYNNKSEWGYAVGGGVTVKLPMLGAGDSATLQAAYSKGAVSYATPDPLFGYDFLPKSISLVSPSMNQTVAWSVAAGMTHNWTSKWSSSATVSYLDHDGASSNFLGLGKFQLDYTQIDAGANLVYTPVEGLTIGAEVEYKTAKFSNGNIFLIPNKETDAVVGLLRVQRNF